MRWCKTHADWQANHIDHYQCRWAVVLLNGQPDRPCELAAIPSHIAQFLAGHSNQAQRALSQ